MLDNQRLSEIDGKVYQQIRKTKEKRELETKAFIDGMEKGAYLMYKAVCEELRKENEQE